MCGECANIEQLNEQLRLAVLNSVYSGKKVVTGGGALYADIVLVGEAPGGDEERQGKPFVGKAGRNLTEFLRVLSLERENIYITNVVKIRPTGVSEKTGQLINRTPTPEEIQFFSPYLHKEIKLISPRVIVTLGNTALKEVAGNKTVSIGSMHGKPLYAPKREYNIFPLYHPAAVIYNQQLKAVYENDLLTLRNILHGGE